MPEIQITVRDKIASQADHAVYVCGCGDYTVLFDFDSEWEKTDRKTARFQTENGYTDVLFLGSRCPVPVIGNTRRLEVGVFAENLRTTTGARVAVRQSIRSQWGPPEDPTPSLYDQLMEAMADTGLDLKELPDGVELIVRYRGGESRAFLRHSEVYVGAGDMPEGYRVQLDPSQGPPLLRVKDLNGNLYPLESIRGEKGEKGDKGDKGDPGPQGPRGDVGENVVRSINGLTPDGDGAVNLAAANVGALPVKGGTMQGALSMGGFALTNLAGPQSASDGATKSYVDSRRKVLRATASTDWTGSGPYSQILSMPELLDSDTPHVAPVYDGSVATALSQRDAWSCISQVEARGGQLILTCLEEKPAVAIPILVEVNR